jgi:hypothetical protein
MPAEFSGTESEFSPDLCGFGLKMRKKPDLKKTDGQAVADVYLRENMMIVEA